MNTLDLQPMAVKVKNRIRGDRARKRREILRQRQNNKCHWCGCEMASVKVKGDGQQKGTTITIEHLIPLSAGGNNMLSNTVAACYDCNINRNTEMQHGTDETKAPALCQSN